MSEHQDRGLPSGRNSFATTHWSVVLTAGGESSPAAQEALEKLCRTYWYPLYAYLRRRGFSPESAADLTQSCFEQLLSGEFFRRARPEKGKFRSYLLGALNRVVRDESQRQQRQKRGGGCLIFSLDAIEAEGRYRREPADPLEPESAFLRRWAMTVLKQAFMRLEAECLSEGKETQFQRLEGYLVGEKSGGSYAVAAQDLHMSEAAVKMAVMRMRGRCRELLREIISETVSTPAEVDDEFQALLSVLRR